MILGSRRSYSILG
ncbi:hypothetical protein LINPERHAP2_LOCUS21784 [Linum perenne]